MENGEKQMTRAQAAAIANCILTFRPGWYLPKLTDVIEELPGPYSVAAEHAIRVASDPRTKSPGMILAIPMKAGEGADRPARPGRREPCDICNRPEWTCGQAQRNTGLNPHEYRPLAGHALP